MLDILRFIFSDFWHWAGTVVLVFGVAVAFANVVDLARTRR